MGLGQMMLHPGFGEIKYLMRDEFHITRAAGAVNGTAAEPGGTGGAALNTRTVTDTESKVTIASGALTFAGGKAVPAWADPGLWYGAVTRTAGRVLCFDFTPGTLTANGTHIGFGDGLAGEAKEEDYFISSAGNLIVTTNTGSSSLIVATVANGTTYTCAIVLRGAGAYYFVKVSGIWTLLYISNSGTLATLYPMYNNKGTTNLTSNYMRIPASTWLPLPLACDTFTRANGVLGNSETTGPDNQAATARAWTAQAGTWGVATNAAACSALAGGVGIATVGVGSINVLCSAAATRSGDNVGIVLRYAGASDYIIAYHDGTNAKLDKVTTADGTTNVISGVAAYGAGRRIQVIADGTAFSLFYNDVKVGSTSTIDDATLQTGTAHGLYTTNTSNALDNFWCFARGSGGEYSALGKF